MKKNNLNNGYTILEVMVSIVIVGIVLISAVALITRSQAAATNARQKIIATSLAEETHEWLRSERDQDWSGFFARSLTATWCAQSLNFQSGTSEGPCSTNQFVPGTNMTREIRFTRSGPGLSKVVATVTVSFADSLGVHSSESTSEYTNWRGNR